MTTGTDAANLASAFLHLPRDGFAVVRDVLTPTEVQHVRSRLVEVARVERAARDPKCEDGPNNQRVFGLLNKGIEFADLLEHPVALALMAHFLDPKFLMSSLTANITGPGGHPMYLHYDQDYVPEPWPPFPLVANIIWMLDDFTEENGATGCIPGSHREAQAGWMHDVMSQRSR
jgi:hypothetical protein